MATYFRQLIRIAHEDIDPDIIRAETVRYFRLGGTVLTDGSYERLDKLTPRIARDIAAAYWEDQQSEEIIPDYQLPTPFLVWSEQLRYGYILYQHSARKIQKLPRWAKDPIKRERTLWQWRLNAA